MHPETTMPDAGLLEGFLYKLLSPLPWLPWLAFIVAAGALAVWLILRLADNRLVRKWDFLPEIKAGNVAVAIVYATIIAVTAWAVVTSLQRAAFGATTRYDHHFRRAAAAHLDVDWRYLKAQGIAESNLRPRVCSGAGACGLMQWMPASAGQWGVDPFRPRSAVWGAARYDAWLMERWSSPRPHWDRLSFALASYNAGMGNVLAFQRAAVQGGGCNVNLWPCVAARAWTEPREYVERINRWCLRLAGPACQPRPGG